MSSRRQLYPHPAAQDLRRAAQGFQCQTGVVLIKQSIQMGSTGPHALGHGGLGEPLRLACLVNLPR